MSPKKTRVPREPRAPRVRKAKAPKVKRVSYELVPDTLAEPGRSMHTMLRDLVRAHHPDLKDARIGLAFCSSWKADEDGRLTLGKCKKASDLDREFAPYDFVILLNQTWWLDIDVEPVHRLALLDHELTHASVKVDARQEPIVDERGRIVYRTRKHDLEEFVSVVNRHGIWRRDIEHFYAALRAAAASGWVPCAECRDNSRPGWHEVADEVGVMRAARCRCWTAHLSRIDPDPPPAAQPKLGAADASATTH